MARAPRRVDCGERDEPGFAEEPSQSFGDSTLELGSRLAAAVRRTPVADPEFGSSQRQTSSDFADTLIGDDDASVAATVREHQTLCPKCRRRLVRSGDVVRCPGCDAVTQFFSADGRCEAETPAASEWVGRLVGLRLGEFRLERLLGEGAAGAVFLARHRQLKRRSALKVLHPDHAEHDTLGLRFLDEARHASALQHPNIVTTHSVGVDPADDGTGAGSFRWIEQEFVGGHSLGDYLDRWALQPSEATRLFIDVASGLAAAHRQQLLHRDIKPDNILLTHCRTAKLGDFGLARPIDNALDRRGTLVGTPNFMAPEIFAGCEPTPTSDVYSLGATFFTMLAGFPPFASECKSLDELSAAVRTRDVPSIRRLRPDVSLEIAECIAQMVDRSPRNRPVDAIAALQLAEALLGHVRDLETLIREAVRDEPCIEWRRIAAAPDDPSGDRYELDVHLPGGRSQRVFLEETDGPYSQRNVTMDSICGPVDAGHFEEMLRLNARLAHGAVAVKPHAGVDTFVMVDSYPRGTLDAEEVRRSVWELAVYADQMEQVLTDGDEH